MDPRRAKLICLDEHVQIEDFFQNFFFKFQTCLYGLAVTLRAAAGKKYSTVAAMSVSKVFEDLLSDMLSSDADNRPSLEEAEKVFFKFNSKHLLKPALLPSGQASICLRGQGSKLGCDIPKSSKLTHFASAIHICKCSFKIIVISNCLKRQTGI